ncbi:hypothetical protein MNBD_BACTEROID01-2177 [hydrothermal vent metagenome]|uniref:Uncharacterized protein n=1 Tax=hydrothermal vent metagenome TaxID=652676 RepID=A0A3B0UXM0_9ZZZZ
MLDGYTKTVYETYSAYTYYHVNWGWDNGSYNGYYTLTDLTPGEENYNYLQEAIVDIKHPNATYSTPPQPSTITAECSGSFCMGETYEFSVSPIDLIPKMMAGTQVLLQTTRLMITFPFRRNLIF